MAYWFGFAAVAGAFGGLIAFGIQSIPDSNISIAHWRLLFIVEGIPTILMGLLSMAFLPNRPEETTFLNERERMVQMERGRRGLRADVGRVVNKSGVGDFFSWRCGWDVLICVLPCRAYRGCV